jgi:capsular polysaccharide biosynthesis protein
VSLGGHFLWEGRHLGIIQKRRRQVAVERGFFLAGYGYFNYYHWMIEILPKLHYWGTVSHELREYPLLVGEAVYRQQTFVDALQCWVKDPEVIILKDDLSYRVGDLLHINAPNTGPFNLLEGEEVRVEDCLLRPEAVGAWRDRMGPRGPKVDGRGLRLFLARDGSRRAYNQDEVLEVFLCEGFQPVYLEKLSLNEQMRRMAAAEFVVGPTGAAWTNLVFCSAGTRALCWMAEQSSGFSFYSNIARIVGVDLRYVTYSTNARSTGELYMADYHVDTVAMRRALHALLKSSKG